MKIKQKAVWSEGQKEWSVPPFTIADKKAECNFPTISGNARAKQMREERQVNVNYTNQ